VNPPKLKIHSKASTDREDELLLSRDFNSRWELLIYSGKPFKYYDV
jgi:hypothetical protein